MRPLWKTKTFWTGIAGIVGGAALCANGQVEAGIPILMNGLTAITLRHAVATSAPPPAQDAPR